MAEPIIEPNFTISDAALAALASLKAHMTRDDPDNPPAVAMVAWGLFYDKQNQKRLENVIVSFYPRSQLAEVEHGIRVVSGLPLIFFVTKETAAHFAGKQLHYMEGDWFFLRDP
jgi:hypothetical protein